MQKGLKIAKYLIKMVGVITIYVLGCLEIRWKK